ncbi:hypothetical protein Tco_1420023, partial [Tanacetum coccineum]
MPPRMTTRNAGRGGVTPRGERTGARSGRGVTDNGNTGNNGNNGGNGNTGGEDNSNEENNEGGHEHGNLRNGDNNNNNGNKCLYKEFLACQPNGMSARRLMAMWVKYVAYCSLKGSEGVNGRNNKF